MDKESKDSARTRTAREGDLTERFSSNAVRLGAGEWAIALAIIVGAMVLLPRIGRRMEPFEPSADYRIPYMHSEDYWLYTRYADHAASHYPVAVIGDSVTWGHYVTPDGTLSHFLNERAGGDLFANLGLDGVRQAALAGLIKYHGESITDHAVILQFNTLWISSPEADMSRGEGEEAEGPSPRARLGSLLTGRELEREGVSLNHARLVPQFFRRPYGYRPRLAEAAGAVAERYVRYLSWMRHMRMTYYEGFGLRSWSVEHPYANPLAVIRPRTLKPEDRPQGRPVPWFEGDVEEQDFPWVALERSYQWRAFRDAVSTLQTRGNGVFVVLGPLNTHLMTADSRIRYGRVRVRIEAWLEENGVPYCAPPALPSELYADSSHPLEEGYARLAGYLLADEGMRDWLRSVGIPAGVGPGEAPMGPDSQ